MAITTTVCINGLPVALAEARIPAPSSTIAHRDRALSDPRLAAARQSPGASSMGALFPADYFVMVRQGDGRVAPVSWKPVELREPLPSLSDADAAARVRSVANADTVVVRLQAPDGRVVFQDVARASGWLRGEFHGTTPESPIDGRIVPLETAPFVVRVPHIAHSTLILASGRGATVSRLDLDHVRAAGRRIAEDAGPLVARTATALGSSNRTTLLVMGDGYSSTQLGKFTTDAATFADSFFSISPYSVYRNYFNVVPLFTASVQSGADHPAYRAGCAADDTTCCPDPAAQADPVAPTFVSTAFDSAFCVAGIQRLLAPNGIKVLEAAAAVPEWDQILLLVNDPAYGGSGGRIPTTSLHPAAAQIAQHEFGHSFVNLADEYVDASIGDPGCSDATGDMPCAPNVTDAATRASVKWGPWIDATTPVPTPDDSGYQGLVGLFEGAMYKATGLYRSGYRCIMRSLGAPYCQVPSQAFVLRLYDGDGMRPGIRLIEPGSTTPATQTIDIMQPTQLTFSAAVLKPVGGPADEITWLVNGVPVPGATDAAYTTTVDAAGSTQVTMRVRDTTPLVSPAMADGRLVDEYTWTVRTSTAPGAPTGVSGTAGDSQVAVKWTPPASDGGSLITGYLVTSDPEGRTCAPSPGTAAGCVVRGLTNGIPYTFTVTATNSVGTGPASAPSAAVTPSIPRVAVPPTASVAGLPTWLAATSVPLSWTAMAGTSPVASYDVRYRRAAWNGSFGSYVTWRSRTTATSASFPGSSGSTYCFSVLARDILDAPSGWTAETCTAVPLDDRSMTRYGRWTAGTSSAFYRSTWLRSYTYGAKLVRTSVVARRIAIVATTCPTCGKVRVYWGSTLLKTVSLYSATTVNKKPIAVTTFTSARTGALSIRVYSSGKKVIIDGVAIRRN